MEKYRALEDSGALQDQEKRLMRQIHRHYPFPSKFTRKELAETVAWTINVICGRVNSLVKKGFLAEYPQTRDGGHLLSIRHPQPNVAPQPSSIVPATPSGLPTIPAAGAAPEQLIQACTKGKPFSYVAVGFGPGWA